jgi:hypothetical protein
MEAWSLNQLGWIALVPATATGQYSLGPVPFSDSVLLVRPTRDNQRGEFFLLENRQAVESDSAMIRLHCDRSFTPFPSACGGG